MHHLHYSGRTIKHNKYIQMRIASQEMQMVKAKVNKNQEGYWKVWLEYRSIAIRGRPAEEMGERNQKNLQASLW